MACQAPHLAQNISEVAILAHKKVGGYATSITSIVKLYFFIFLNNIGTGLHRNKLSKLSKVSVSARPKSLRNLHFIVPLAIFGAV